MAYKKHQGWLPAVVLVGACFVIGNGCSSSSKGSAGPGNTDSGSGGDTGSGDDSGSGSGSGSSSGGLPGDDASGSSSGGEAGGPCTPGKSTDGSTLYDGTVGKPCTSDSDCQVNGMACTNICSTSYYKPSMGSRYPTAVCINVTCDPAPPSDPTGQYIHFCDGPDNTLATPGICVPTTSPPKSGMGLCLPQCEYSNDGAAAKGCVGKDACTPYAFGTLTSGSPIALGICYGGCTQDTDCPTGNHCQLDTGICVAQTKTRTLQPGDPCTAADADPSTNNPGGKGNCSCVYDTQTLEGYCTTYCITGATSGPGSCPTLDSGVTFTCDNSTPSSITTSSGSTPWGTTAENAGVAGSCYIKCAPSDAGAGDAGGTCPYGGAADGGGGGDLCSSATIAGPDCLPGAAF
ncbi:MAG TPA: hypothetical protein VF765_04995 [Polyangiaceae bacterium]